MSKPLKDTKLGQFLSNNFPKVLHTVGDVLPNSGVLGIVKNIIGADDSLTPEQKAQALQQVQEFEKEMFEAEAKDRDSARNREIQVNQNPNAGWLAKNTVSLIALCYTLFNFAIYILILFGDFKVSDNMAILIVNSITNIAMMIIGYYFGSSVEKHRSIQPEIDWSKPQR